MATILVAEDNRVNQRVLSYTLRKEGHKVISTSNGFEALEYLAGNSVDLIIADIEMPKMDGIALVKHLRADKLYKTIPIIVLTASGQNQDHATVTAAGANDVLTKPSSSQKLIDTIDKILN
ncbi:MAG: response regulator [Anaerolineae bacterium]|nr:response regulator [Anaerolineae bacterium]